MTTPARLWFTFPAAMRTIIVGLLAALAGCEPSEMATLDAAVDDVASDAPAGTLVVVTINARCLIDDWDARLPILADGLVAAGVDVVGLQEVCSQPGGRDVLEELVAALTARGAGQFAFTRTTTHFAWDMYNEGLAILSRHPIGEVRVTELPAGALPRKLLAARIMAPAGPRLFGVTHLDHQSTATRGQQAQAVATALDAFAPGVPTVLVGDLNETPGGSVSSALTAAGLVDAWQALKPSDAGYTFPASGPTIRIDYVWTRGDAVGATSIDRIFSMPAGSTYASDHLGIRAILGK